MNEKIGNLAERLATNVSQSRRGFLAHVGQAALGVAGVLGGLLALPGAAQAEARQGHCVLTWNGQYYITTGYCVTSQCTYGYSSACYGLATRAGGREFKKCGGMVFHNCSF
jgi:hypothetical protein